jgi:hypothetical protein
MRNCSGAVLFLYLFCAGCSTQSDTAEEITFSVNPNLLGESFIEPEHGFSISAPLAWNSVSDSSLTAAKEAVAQSESPRPDAVPELLAVFRHPTHGAQLIVSRYGGTMSAVDRSSLMENQGKGLRMELQDSEISHAKFSHNGYKIDQYRVIAQDIVIFKLFVQHPESGFYQLDYLLPLANYEAELRALESSIGSLAYQHPAP